MNITTFSPALTLLYVFALLWILMGVDAKSFNQTQRRLIIFVVLLLLIGNHLLRMLIGPEIYARLLIVCMHLPTFLLFLYIAKRGIIKTAFMILTALVFTAPIILIGNLIQRVMFAGSTHALLLSNLIAYILMLLLAQFVFRNIFNYLLVHGDNHFFLLFSIIPFIFYIYVLAAANLDFSALSSPTGYLVRLIPSIEVFVFYFLLPYIYKTFREKQILTSDQAIIQLQLDFMKEQISLLNETNMQMTIYRHDMRHQLIMLDGLLSKGNIEQAREFINTGLTDLVTLTPKRFCENETVNLICASYDSQAQRLGVRLNIHAQLPAHISLSDTELCSVISNGLENALRAASQPEVTDKWVNFYCEIKQSKLIIQIQNTYAGHVTIQNGLPISTRDGHGYGCRSIQAIAQRHSGLYTFKAENGLFTFQLVFFLSNHDTTQDANSIIKQKN